MSFSYDKVSQFYTLVSILDLILQFKKVTIFEAVYECVFVCVVCLELSEDKMLIRDLLRLKTSK